MHYDGYVCKCSDYRDQVFVYDACSTACACIRDACGSNCDVAYFKYLLHDRVTGVLVDSFPPAWFVGSYCYITAGVTTLFCGVCVLNMHWFTEASCYQ